MRQRDCTLGKGVSKARSLRRRLFLPGALDTPHIVTLKILKHIPRLRPDVSTINVRSLSISISSFNIKVHPGEAALREFRFQIKDMFRISVVMGWSAGKTVRNGYKYISFTACCIVLRRMASPCRWADLEYTFGMRSYALSEVFWEVLESFYEKQGHLVLHLQEGLLVRRAEMYAERIHRAVAPHDSFACFIDCTRIQMSRPSGHSSLQRSCYSGHKLFHYLMYHTVTTPDGLIFHLHGTEVGRD